MIGQMIGEKNIYISEEKTAERGKMGKREKKRQKNEETTQEIKRM